PEGQPDYIGGFVVTSGAEEDKIAQSFKERGDDYSAIMVQALGDRFAEGLAELLHAKVRREYWGFARDEAFTPTEMIAEPYDGIRPASGYPAQPDHTEKETLFRLLDATAHTGVRLTESMAMHPGASVSGLYIAHPDAYYFGVAKVEADQAADYAARKGMALRDVERWLMPVLNYTPKD
ncbi:MAG: vitamin B12 dependent-methionine synthase activation domain-containing protein, partial [Paracoccus sp. (in: a-proteobacteria)]|nr:vitamin B12 dependent-methionine synthase activation domain-containing protein [Paracoccus sp. (in: a-proteobacteria)]